MHGQHVRPRISDATHALGRGGLHTSVANADTCMPDTCVLPAWGACTQVSGTKRWFLGQQARELPPLYSTQRVPTSAQMELRCPGRITAPAPQHTSRADSDAPTHGHPRRAMDPVPTSSEIDRSGGDNPTSKGGCTSSDASFVLLPGDVLYIPRGCVHWASTEGAAGKVCKLRTNAAGMHLMTTAMHKRTECVPLITLEPRASHVYVQG